MNAIPTCHKVLLVEDSEDDIELAQFALKKSNANFGLIVVRSGEEALDYLLSTNQRESGKRLPALVLLDIQLPGINGLEVLRRLREHDEEKIKCIPVAMFSSSTNKDDLAKAYALTADRYFCKPINVTAFSNLLREIGQAFNVGGLVVENLPKQPDL